MKKVELAELLARALNLLGNINVNAAHADEEDVTVLGSSELGELHGILNSLPEDVRNDWFNNGTIKAKELM